MAASYLESTHEDIIKMLDDSMKIDHVDNQNDYENTKEFYDNPEDHIKDFIVCDNSSCQEMIEMTCRNCYSTLDIKIWINSTIICKCGEENFYYHLLNDKEEYKCKKCKEVQSNDETIEVVSLLFNL